MRCADSTHLPHGLGLGSERIDLIVDIRRRIRKRSRGVAQLRARVGVAERGGLKAEPSDHRAGHIVRFGVDGRRVEGLVAAVDTDKARRLRVRARVTQTRAMRCVIRARACS